MRTFLIVCLAVLILSSCSLVDPSYREISPDIDKMDINKEKAEQNKTREAKSELKQEEVSIEKDWQDFDREVEQLNEKMKRTLQKSKARGEADKPEQDGEKKGISGAQKVEFNFYDADLDEVIRLFMDLLEADFMLHPGLKGSVSLAVDDKFTDQQLINLLRGLLRINNAGMVKKDNVWEIMPFSEVAKNVSGQDSVIFEPGSDVKLGQKIYAFRLHFVPGSEMINVLKPFLSQNAIVYAHQNKGILLVCDYPHNLEKITQLVDIFDESVFADKLARVFNLRYVKAEDMAEDMQKIAEKFGLNKENLSPNSKLSFVPLERLNMILVIARDKDVLEMAEAWIRQMDREMPEALDREQETNIFVYYVQYANAEEMLDPLENLMGSSSTSSDDEDDQLDQKSTEDKEGAQKSNQTAISGELSGEVKFTVDKATNSILTKCSSDDYKKVLSVMEKLDQYPKQVLIEVLIAEVQLSDSTQLGFEWQYIFDMPDKTQGTLQLDSGLGTFSDGGTAKISSGLSYLVQKTDVLTAALKANVDKNKLHILSRPTLISSDNKKATINIGNEVPIPTSRKVKGDETTTTETTETDIQYRDTGIILHVTPQINKHGMVRMEISQEVSDISTKSVKGVDAPVISNRSAETTVAVNDQQTVVIGGLMQQTRNNGRSGIPYLQRIPLLRNIFGYESHEFENTELIIFITPYVILSEYDSNQISSEFIDRLEDLKNKMFN